MPAPYHSCFLLVVPECTSTKVTSTPEASSLATQSIALNGDPDACMKTLSLRVAPEFIPPKLQSLYGRNEFRFLIGSAHLYPKVIGMGEPHEVTSS
jgi:hypothetical protein